MTVTYGTPVYNLAMSFVMDAPEFAGMSYSAHKIYADVLAHEIQQAIEDYFTGPKPQ